MADKHYRNKDSTLFCKKNHENNIILDPVIQNVFRLLNLILSNVKGKTKKYANKVLIKMNFMNHFKKGSKLMSKTILCAFTELIKHAINIDDLNQVAFLLPSYPLPVLNCSTFNDLADLEADNDEPGICRQWQIAPLQLWKPRINLTHLQSHWKKPNMPSRSNSRINNYPITVSPTIVDDDEMDELLECDRFSQVSSSVITSLNVDEQNRINHLEQTLADLQKQMTILLQAKQNIQIEQTNCTSNLPNNQTVKNDCVKIAPPPPPPPLPSDFLSSKPPPLLLKNNSISNLTEKKKTSNNKPTLMDLLKDIGNVKLRKVEAERSPNGTPIRLRPKMVNYGIGNNLQSTSSDYFQMALMRKFKNVCPSGSFTDTDNEDLDSHSSGVWDDE